MIIAILLLFTALAGLLLLPRIHLKCEYGSDRFFAAITWLWLNIRSDIRNGEVTGRILFFRLPLKKKKKEPSQAAPREKYTAEKTVEIQPEPAKEGAVEPEEKIPEPTDDYTVTEKKIKFRKVKKSIKGEPEKKDSKKKMTRLLWREHDLILQVLRRFVSGFIRLLQSIRTDYFRMRLDMGAGDPMITGILYGVMQPLELLNLTKAEVDIIPLFEDEKIEMDLSCSFSMMPIQVVIVVIREMFKFPWLRVVRVGLHIRRGSW